MASAEHIKKLRAQRAQAAKTVEALDTAIANEINAVMDAGYSPTRLAEELGITRARLYQIRARRRSNPLN